MLFSTSAPHTSSTRGGTGGQGPAPVCRQAQAGGTQSAQLAALPPPSFHATETGRLHLLYPRHPSKAGPTSAGAGALPQPCNAASSCCTRCSTNRVRVYCFCSTSQLSTMTLSAGRQEGVAVATHPMGT